MLDTDDNYQHFGTALPPLEEDDVPATKKPIQIEDQVVKDEFGKRRFHGAFTGGFSAGYWNTVGSQEGWTPQNFKSSRSEKAAQREKQRPEDFMDSEDLGEFGIAPQQIQVREDFAMETDNNSRKRKRVELNVGPIPGTPVLHVLLKPVNDKIAVRILKSWGWRPGQGIGPRQTRKEKKMSQKRNQRELYLMQQYGYEPGNAEQAAAKEHDENMAAADDDDADEEGDDDDDDDDEEAGAAITFAPDDYEPMLCNPKENRFGHGYSGLSRAPILAKSGKTIATQQHFNLFPTLEVLDKQNQKLSIRGQAFGVGALEEEDEDIYARDDLTKYDFSLEHKKKEKKVAKNKEAITDIAEVAGFEPAANPMQFQQTYTIDLPRDYKPRNWAERRSRFAPLDAVTARKLEKSLQNSIIEANKLTPDARGQLLGEPQDARRKVKQQQQEEQLKQQQKAKDDKAKALLARISAKGSNFTQGGIITAEGDEQPKTKDIPLLPAVQQENACLLEKANKLTKDLVSTTDAGNFKPFINDEAKQKRYEQFLAANLKTEAEVGVFLRELQPVTLSEWDREMEKKEFIQARKIYKPLGGIMSDRFVSEAKVEAVKQEITAKKEAEKKIVMERNKSMWKPDALLCKRYNIPEPFGGTMVEVKKPKQNKMSVFDYLESSINTKSNFQTPVIIPKHIEKPQAIVENFKPTQTVNEIKEKSDEVTETRNETKDKAKESQNRLATENVSISISSKSIETTKSFKFVPKTELEKKVVESQDKPIAEKVELFKAIFGDSDEDEDAHEKQQEETNAVVVPKPDAAIVANLLRNTSPPRGIFAALFSNTNEKRKDATESETKMETETESDAKVEVSKAKAAQEQRVETPKIAFKSRLERTTSQKEAEKSAVAAETEVDASAVYGPKIPTNLLKVTKNQNQKDLDEQEIDKKLTELFEKQKRQKSIKNKYKIEEQWVEKTVATTKKITADSDNDDDDDDDSDSDSSVGGNSESSKSSTSVDKNTKKKKLKKKNKKNTDKSKMHKKKSKNKHKNKNKNKEKSTTTHKHKKHKKKDKK